jgi:hypothetical protein
VQVVESPDERSGTLDVSALVRYRTKRDAEILRAVTDNNLNLTFSNIKVWFPVDPELPVRRRQRRLPVLLEHAAR